MADSKPAKSWYKRWWAILLIFIGIMLALGSLFGDDSSTSNNQISGEKTDNDLGSSNTETQDSQEQQTTRNSYQSCIRDIFKGECQKYSLLYTDYSEAVQFITCTDDGSYTVNDIGESSKYLQVYAPTRILEMKCGVYQEPTNPKLKCEEDLFQSKCEGVGLIYTDWSSAVGFITCTDEGLYTMNDIGSNSKYQQVYITQEFVDSQCS